MALTIKHRLSLDLSLGTVQATVPFRKGDVAAHEVIFGIRNGSEVVELPVGTMAAICIYNGANGGDGVSDLCTVDHLNHTVSYIPTREALSVAGSVHCDLRIIGSDGSSLGSPKFIFFVDDTMADVTEAEIDEALHASDAWGIIQSARANALAAEASREAAKESAEKAAEAAATFDMNFMNGEGEGSIVQKDGGVTDSAGKPLREKDPVKYNSKAPGRSAVAINVRNNANGDASFAQGYNSTANTKGDAAFNSGIAGLTEAEFLERYPTGYLLNKEYLAYAEFILRVVNGAFACGNGRALGLYSFSAGSHNAGLGSWAPYSATFGYWNFTKYGWYTDENGNRYYADASESCAGGKYCAINRQDSFVWGEGLTIGPNSEGKKLPKAAFGKYNKAYHNNEVDENTGLTIPEYEALMEFGNGTDTNHPSNSVVITYDGRAKGFGAPRDYHDFVRLGDLKALSDALGRLNDGGVA